jgi:hypothetical protein
MARYIRHVTLTTGHVRDSAADEIDADALAACRDLIARVTAGSASESASIPGCPGYSLMGRANGRCIALTVWADGPPSECICTIGVARHSRCGATLWQALCVYGTGPLGVPQTAPGDHMTIDPARQPSVPWVAAALEEPIARHMDAAQWLGDFSRCLAWAWIAMLEGRP